MPAKPVTIKQDTARYLFICNLLCAKEVFIPLDVANRKKLLVARENRLHINGVVWKAARVANKRNSTKQEDDPRRTDAYSFGSEYIKGKSLVTAEFGQIPGLHSFWRKINVTRLVFHRIQTLLSLP